MWCGPMSVEARGGYRYVLTLNDDLSRYWFVYLMKHKSETFQKFKEFQSEIENQRDRKIKFLRSDRGGKYSSHEFGTHLRNVELFHNSRRLEHLSVIVCPNIVIALYWIWCDLLCLLPICRYHFGVML